MQKLEKYLSKFSGKNNPDLEHCKNSSKPIAIMPAGYIAQSFLEYLKFNSLSASLFVDNDPAKQGTEIDGIPVVSVDEYKKVAAEYSLLLISQSPVVLSAIKQQLRGNEIVFQPAEYADYNLATPAQLNNLYDVVMAGMDKFTKLELMLEDDLSLNTLAAILEFRITYDCASLKSIARPLHMQYFEPEIYQVTSEDIFVDAGAYNGDTFREICSLTGGKIKGYYGFEPDEENFDQLQKSIGAVAGCTAIKSGVYSSSTTLRFKAMNNSISRIDEDSDTEIDVKSIDDVIGDVIGEAPVTFIKMDIEGAEADALLGAKETIIKHKPALAICVYHKYADIYELPFLIESFGVDYKYYLRHYNPDNGCETVIYAVAK